MQIDKSFLKSPELIAIGDLEFNEENPRKADFSKIKQLADKIKEDPEFFARRSVLVNRITEEGKKTRLVIYAGEQRTKAAKHMGYLEVPCIIDDNLPKEVMDRRMALDNKHEGSWDDEMFVKLFSEEQAKAWGFNEIKFPDDYEKTLAKLDDTTAVMPIVPKFNEKYDAVVIYVDTELDMNWLRNVLQLDKVQCYKSSRIGETRVISVKDVQKALENYGA